MGRRCVAITRFMNKKNRQPLYFEQAVDLCRYYHKTVNHPYSVVWSPFHCVYASCICALESLILYVQLKPFWRSLISSNLRAWFSNTNRTKEQCHLLGKPEMTAPWPAPVTQCRLSSRRVCRLESSSKMHSCQESAPPRLRFCVNRHSPFLHLRSRRYISFLHLSYHK